MEQKENIRQLTLAELKDWLAAQGEKPFRAKQIYQWLWKKNVASFDQMTDLGKTLRERLDRHFAINHITVAQEQKSKDGSIKVGFALHDGELIEGVLIPTTDRVTACVSSQSGCSLSCKFCATGYMPLKRNLDAAEIYDQVYMLNQMALDAYGQGLTNIVYMGMGEPLLNYRQVMDSIAMVTGEDGLGMSARRITVSTAGIAKMIKKLADDGFRCEFALSLHAADDAKRSQIMPINDSNSLDALAEALQYFYQKTGTRATLEYVFLGGVNDSMEDALRLSDFARRAPTKINIIEYNPIAFADFVAGKTVALDAFVRILERAGHVVNVRRSRGKDVDGACGQLAIKQQVPAQV